MHASQAYKLISDWKRCREKVLGPCAQETDGCCAIVPCQLCIFLETNDGQKLESIAVWTNGSYIGVIDGRVFEAFWERDAYDGCVFYVYLDDLLVYGRGKCQEDPYKDTVDCRGPDDEAEIPPYGELLRWETVDPLELRHRKLGITSCRLDVVFAIDLNAQASDILADFKAAAQTIVDGIKSRADTYRIALVSFTTPTANPVIHQVLTKNNDSEWLTAVDALVSESAVGATANDFERKSHTSLERIANEEVGVWLKRNEKYVVLISQGYPQDTLTAGDVPLLDEQLSAALQLASDDVQVNTISIPSATGAFNETYVTWQETTALAGNGNHSRIRPSTINGGINEFKLQFQNGFEPKCLVTKTNCKKPFCGECKCFPRKICVTIRTTGCIIILEVEADDTCENPTWEFEADCGYASVAFTLVLYADEITNECKLQLTGEGETLIEDVEDCKGAAIDYFFAYSKTEVSIESADCQCGTPDCPCCSSAASNGIIEVRGSGYLTLTADSTCNFAVPQQPIDGTVSNCFSTGNFINPTTVNEAGTVAVRCYTDPVTGDSETLMAMSTDAAVSTVSADEIAAVGEGELVKTGWYRMENVSFSCPTCNSIGFASGELTDFDSCPEPLGTGFISYLAEVVLTAAPGQCGELS